MSEQPDIQFPKALISAQRLANLTDTAVRLPILNIRLGLDFIIGLVPVIGDMIMLLVALRIVHAGKQIGAPKSVQQAMLRNVLLDWLVGLVPFAGDLFDLIFKVNQRNVRLLEKWWVTTHHEQIRASADKQLQQWIEDNTHN
jgi:hypothetical protein